MSKEKRFDIAIGILDHTENAIERIKNQHKFEKDLSEFLNTNTYSKDKKWVFGMSNQVSEKCSKNIDTLIEKDQRIAELEEQLSRAIVPKFKTYQQIFYITQYYTSTKGNPKYDIISDKYYVAENENEIILGWNYAKDFNQRKYYYVRKDWVFATKEEAEQKLAEIKGEKDE